MRRLQSSCMQQGSEKHALCLCLVEAMPYLGLDRGRLGDAGAAQCADNVRAKGCVIQRLNWGWAVQTLHDNLAGRAILLDAALGACHQGHSRAASAAGLNPQKSGFRDRGQEDPNSAAALVGYWVANAAGRLHERHRVRCSGERAVWHPWWSPTHPRLPASSHGIKMRLYPHTRTRTSTAQHSAAAAWTGGACALT